MTYRKFKQIARQHRPDAVVHQHKTFGGVPDVAIYFTNPDGSESKVYNYRGSYATILNQLGVNVVTLDTIKQLEYRIDVYKRSNGQKNLFTGKINDHTAEIEKLTAQLDAYHSNKYIRDWE